MLVHTHIGTVDRGSELANDGWVDEWTANDEACSIIHVCMRIGTCLSVWTDSLVAGSIAGDSGGDQGDYYDYVLCLEWFVALGHPREKKGLVDINDE